MIFKPTLRIIYEEELEEPETLTEPDTGSVLEQIAEHQRDCQSLTEIHFAEPHPTEYEEPSWFTDPTLEITNEHLRSLYDQWYGQDYEWEPLEDKDFLSEAISYIATADYSVIWKGKRKS